MISQSITILHRRYVTGEHSRIMSVCRGGHEHRKGRGTMVGRLQSSLYKDILVPR